MAMKKNNEEIKEMLLKARALSDEELEQVVGGKEIKIDYIPQSDEYEEIEHVSLLHQNDDIPDGITK